MTHNDVRNQIREQAPVRIHLTDGRAFDIPHRDYSYVSRTAVYIFNPSPDIEGVAEDLRTVCSIRNITSIQPLQQTVP